MPGPRMRYTRRRPASSSRRAPAVRIAAFAAGAAAAVAVVALAIGTGVQAGVGNGGSVGAVIDAIEAGRVPPFDERSRGGVAGDDGQGAPDAADGAGPDAPGGERPGAPGPGDPGDPAEPPAEGAPPTTPDPEPTPTPGDPTVPPSEDPGDGRPTPTPPPTLDPSDPMSPAYNPYTTPGDPAYVDDDAKRAWLGQEAVVRACMAEAGFEYVEWQWWYGGSPVPDGLDAAGLEAWMRALRGGDDGCEAVGARAAAEAEAAGTPLTADIPPAPDGPTERQHWLEFQDAVRACMSSAGHEYRYWEYWNPAYSGADGALPAMPAGLAGDARAAWESALYGGAADGESATSGCWAEGKAQAAYDSWY